MMEKDQMADTSLAYPHPISGHYEFINENLTLYEIRTIGFDALTRELGPAGAIRFIQQYESSYRDFTRNRKKLLPKKYVREIGRQIIKHRQSKTK